MANFSDKYVPIPIDKGGWVYLVNSAMNSYSGKLKPLIPDGASAMWVRDEKATGLFAIDGVTPDGDPPPALTVAFPVDVPLVLIEGRATMDNFRVFGPGQGVLIQFFKDNGS